ncbi:MAG TPA: autotransporter-associated beta strand repeat-containing protein, partial [Tepidisphaeraceae bacterium]|nr:autotransporter-associated beta strand repeat-containing protein [Tepidisphaeraceae bacterium]
AAAGSGVIKLNGAGLTMVGGTYVNGLTFAGINSVNITANAQLGALAGGGTFNLNTGSTVTLAGDTSGFAGALNLTNNGFLRFNGGLGSANAAFDLGVGTGNLLSRNGNVTIALGALRGGANTRVTGASSAGNLTTYSIGGAGLSTTFAGGITDGGFADSTADITAVTKTGAGALVLTGTANAYTGATAVNAGLLEVNGSLGNTAVTVASGAALTGGGIIGSATGGAVTLQTGAKLAPGAGGGTGPGNLRVGNGLTLATGSNLSFDLTSSPAGNNDKITLNGGVLTMNGTINVSFNLVDGYLAPGTYTLITGGANTSAAGATFAFNLPAGARQTYNLVRPVSGNGECYVQLVVSGNPSANLLWRPGAGSTAWDLNATPNWKNGAATETFFNLDGVTFDNDAAGVVDLAGSVKPREVVVNNPSAAYTFGGAGTLDGSGSLTKTGAGVLTLNGTGVNTYAGGTFLNGGTLQLGNDIANASALGTGPITLANGTTLKMFDSAAGGAQIANWNLVVPTGSNATVWQDSRSQITGTLSGGGTLNLRESWVRNDLIADASNFTGQINVITDNDGGEFRFGTNYAYAGFPNAAVNLADKVAAFYIGTVSEEADGTVIDIGELTGAVGSTLRGGLTGGRTVTYRIGGRNTNAAFAGTIAEQNLDSITSLVKTGTGTWTLTGNASYKGTTVVEAGTLRVAGSLASAGGSFVVKSGATLDLAGGTLTADSIEVEPGGMILGTGAIVGDLVNNGTVTLGGGDGTFLSVSGEVQNLGTMTIDGRAISMGALTVVAGSTTKLATRGNIVLDVGTLNLEPGASLDLRNNALIVRSGNVGTWTGSTFDGVTGQVRDGRNGGAWNGNGIVTTVAPNQPADLTTLAVAPASHVLGLSGADTGTWNGRTVDASAILVKYTYTGDADLNGKINGDDYFIIDSKIAQSSALRGWRFGDFNYDGKINGDDYFSLDSNIARQGVVL